MLKTIIPILVLIGAVFLGKYFMETGPEARKRPFVRNLPVVEVMSLKTEPYTVFIKTSGIVKAGTSSDIVSEVSGRIVKISDNFQEGSYFDKNQTLLQIDQSTLLSNVEIAKSEVAVNKASLVQLDAEQRSNLNSIKLAQQNLSIGYKELKRVRALFKRKTISRSALDSEEQRINQLQQALQNQKGTQSTFASRKSAIQARINSSQSRVKQEELKLTKARIKAPYAGRVLKKHVDIGQFVSTGTRLAETFATDFVNVELPLSGAALDAQSRQINVIVRVDNPYKAREGISAPIRIGQYLEAEIQGRTFSDVYVLPPVAVIYNREVRLLKDGKIKIVPVEVVWNSNNSTIVRSKENIVGEQLILTNLTQAVNGLEVLTVEQQKKRIKAQAKEQEARAKRKKEKSKQAEKERKKTRVIPEQISRKNIELKEQENMKKRQLKQDKSKELLEKAK